MLKRYHITLGATTTAGGSVSSASALISVAGARIALEGDEVSCPVCHAKGIIGLDGPRLSERFNNRQVALSEDLCICRCSPPPKLANSQTSKYQMIDAGTVMATSASAAGGQGQPARTIQPRTDTERKAAVDA